MGKGKTKNSIKYKFFYDFLFWFLINSLFIYPLKHTYALQHSLELFSDSDFQIDSPWLKEKVLQGTDSAKKDLQSSKIRLIEILKRSPTGNSLIQMANEKSRKLGGTILDVITPGNTSFMDSTFIREYQDDNLLHIEYFQKQVIYINRQHSIGEAVVDMAHELTHYIYKKVFNPFIERKDIVDYISNVIEGEGGEVFAVLMECVVATELHLAKNYSNPHCEQIMKMDKDEARAYLTKIFYQLGEHYQTFNKELHDKWFITTPIKYVSGKNSSFVSAVAKIPYPYAAMVEYEQLLTQSCEYEGKRIFKLIHENDFQHNEKSFQNQGEQDRREGEILAKIDTLKNTYIDRCGNFSI